MPIERAINLIFDQLIDEVFIVQTALIGGVNLGHDFVHHVHELSIKERRVE